MSECWPAHRYMSESIVQWKMISVFTPICIEEEENIHNSLSSALVQSCGSTERMKYSGFYARIKIKVKICFCQIESEPETVSFARRRFILPLKWNQDIAERKRTYIFISNWSKCFPLIECSCRHDTIGCQEPELCTHKVVRWHWRRTDNKIIPFGTIKR